MYLDVRATMVAFAGEKKDTRTVKVMLVKKGSKWSLPVVDLDNDHEIGDLLLSTLDNAVNPYIRQIHAYDEAYREIGRTITVSHVALVRNTDVTYNRGQSEWFDIKFNWGTNSRVVSVDVIDADGNIVELVHGHDSFLCDAVNDVLDHVYGKNDIFYLVNEQFTLRDLQDVYEFFIGGEFMAFRRFIQPYVEATGEKERGVGRPSQLFIRKA